MPPTNQVNPVEEVPTDHSIHDGSGNVNVWSDSVPHPLRVVQGPVRRSAVTSQLVVLGRASYLARHVVAASVNALTASVNALTASVSALIAQRHVSIALPWYAAR
eukprot:7784756-Pyramimonas_sp.AAC.1